MGESDTLPVSAEVLPPTPASPSEDHRVSLTSEEFTPSETTPLHSHLPHTVPKEPTHHSVVIHHHDPHHHQSANAESILHLLTGSHHHTNLVESEGKHSETKKSDGGGEWVTTQEHIPKHSYDMSPVSRLKEAPMFSRIPSLSQSTKSGNPRCSGCCQTVQAELIEINAKNDWNHFSPQGSIGYRD